MLRVEKFDKQDTYIVSEYLHRSLITEGKILVLWCQNLAFRTLTIYSLLVSPVMGKVPAFAFGCDVLRRTGYHLGLSMQKNS